jgi:hypothetical protein
LLISDFETLDIVLRQLEGTYHWENFKLSHRRENSKYSITQICHHSRPSRDISHVVRKPRHDEMVSEPSQLDLMNLDRFHLRPSLRWDNLWFVTLQSSSSPTRSHSLIFESSRLNESFATLLGELVTLSMIRPQWDSDSAFSNHHLRDSLRLDGKRSSHPIEQECKSEEEIARIFDDISYGKGAVVLRMLKRLVFFRICF